MHCNPEKGKKENEKNHKSCNGCRSGVDGNRMFGQQQNNP